MAPVIKPRHVATDEHAGTDISQLVGDLANHSPAVRERAREALVALGKAGVASLIGLLSHREPHVRWEAAKALRDIADPLAATALVNALEDDEADIRWLASEGLAALGRDGLEPLLAALLERAQSCRSCEGAHHVCHALAPKMGFGPILRPVLAALEQAEPAIGVPLAAYIALSKLRGFGAVRA